MSQQPWICPRCEKVHAPHVDSCDCFPVSGAKESAAVPAPPAANWSYPWPPPSLKPYQLTPATIWQEPCAFDSLPPGVYNLVCFCPKCSPRCGTWSGTIKTPATVSITYTFTNVTLSSVL